MPEVARPVVLVTGAAGGIGRGLCERLRRDGWSVCGVDRDAAGLAALPPGDDFTPQVADLLAPEACRAAVAAAAAWRGRLDALVNNAGIGLCRPLAEQTDADWRRVVDTDLSAPYFLARAAAPLLAARLGAIVNISSTRAYQSEAGWEAYGAAKAGLIGLTHALAVSLAGRVRVNVVCPGWICCDPAVRLTDADHAQHPAGRAGRPADVAGLVSWLLSADAGFVTGQSFIIDGGMVRKMIYV
jgi:hypothetical protein